jgi:hypothetical protein
VNRMEGVEQKSCPAKELVGAADTTAEPSQPQLLGGRFETQLACVTVIRHLARGFAGALQTIQPVLRLSAGCDLPSTVANV